MQKPIAAEKLFVPNFRPADKLVWNGERFVVAPAGQLAHMTHPETGRQMMVVEPTATKLVPFNSSFIGNGWPQQQLVEPVESLLPGGQAVIFTPVAPTNGFVKEVGVFPANEQTAIAILRKTGTLQGAPVLAFQDLTSNSLNRIRYNWETDQLTLVPSSQFTTNGYGRIKLSHNTILLWLTVTNMTPGNSRRVLIYPDNGPGLNPTEIHHLDVENTAYWTSPVVTGDTAVTRAGDVLRIDDYDKKVIGADSSGSMFVEYEYPMGELDSNNYYLFAETVDGLSTARQMIYPAGIANRERAHLYQNGTPSIANITNLDAVGVIRKAAASFGGESLAVALNGRGASDINATGLIAGINRAAISSSVGLATRPIWVSKIWRDHTCSHRCRIGGSDIMTNWTPLYLRAADEAAMMDALSDAGLVQDVDGQTVVSGNNRTHVAVLGILSRGTGVMLDDGEGGDYEEQEPIPGYHVNVLTLDQSVIDALAPVTIEPAPATPMVVWQGVSG